MKSGGCGEPTEGACGGAAKLLYHTRYRNFCSLLLLTALVESALGIRFSNRYCAVTLSSYSIYCP